jgi:predicted lipid-binding transport protein (Tim44 family)
VDGYRLLEIIILALFAGFLILRLRSVLGRRTGNERPRPDSSVNPPSNLPNTRADRDRTQPATELDVQEVPPALTADTNKASLPDDDKPAAATSVAGNLLAIKRADPNFNEQAFTEGAKAAFEMIVNAFATGDKQTLQTLLGRTVLTQFSAAIDQRKTAGETLSTTFVGVDKTTITGATLQRTMAKIDVKIASRQINVTRDKDGKIIDGDPAEIDKVIDIWSFERDIRSRDPTWLLVDTRQPV